jgi:hypothetical protein
MHRGNQFERKDMAARPGVNKEDPAEIIDAGLTKPDGTA